VASRSRVVDLLFRLCKLITFIFGFVELQTVFTAVPSNPFTVLEGDNISLEWGYDLGVSGSFQRIEFEKISPLSTDLILEVNSVGQYPVDKTPAHFDNSYTGRLQANVTATQTSITILGANRTVDSKNYQFKLVGDNRISSSLTISVQCKYKSLSVFTFQYLRKNTLATYFFLLEG